MMYYFHPCEGFIYQLILILNGNCPTFPLNSIKILDEPIILFSSYSH